MDCLSFTTKRTGPATFADLAVSFHWSTWKATIATSRSRAAGSRRLVQDHPVGAAREEPDQLLLVRGLLPADPLEQPRDVRMVALHQGGVAQHPLGRLLLHLQVADQALPVRPRVGRTRGGLGRAAPSRSIASRSPRACSSSRAAIAS